MKRISSIFAIVVLMLLQLTSLAQDNVLIGNVKIANPRSLKPILENNEIRGYFFFYISDKVDKKTNEYTIQIYDENLRKSREIVFEGDKHIQLLESSYNGNSMMFLFYDSKEKTLEYRAYGIDGKQKVSYVKELNKRSKLLIEQTYGTKSEDAQNEALFDIPNVGFTTIYPVKEGKYYSYEVNFLFTDRKKQWTYEAAEEQDDKYSGAVYMGNTDSLILFEVIKQKTLLGGKPHSWLLALNIFSGKKEFEISTEAEDDYKFYPTNISTIEGSKEFFLMGTYYDKDDKIAKDKSQGIAAWKMDVNGKVLSKKYNSWTGEIGKYLNTDKKGRVADMGYIFFHKVVQTNDGSFYAIGEGYKKVVSAMGVMSAMMNRGSGGVSTFKIKVTDLVLMKFNNSFEIKGAEIYEKYNNSIEMPAGAGYLSPHTMALIVKAYGGFDYDYTKLTKDKSSFTMAYSDYEKSKDFKGMTFNTISYNNSKITTDKINLSSKNTFTRVLPAKTGSVMVWEYNKKKKEVSLRLEKMN